MSQADYRAGFIHHPATYTPSVLAHAEGARSALHVEEPVYRSADQELYARYRDAGEPHGPTIYMSAGEHWTEVAPGLMATVAEPVAPRYFGYGLFSYGTQAQRDQIRELIRREHMLPPSAEPPMDWDVGVASKSTRTVMFDYGRIILAAERTTRAGGRPVALSFAPAWDYQGVFEATGFHVSLLPISHRTGFVPDLDRWRRHLEVLSREGGDVRLVIINAQNNPTGVQWSPEVVHFLIDVAVRNKAWLLVDDAYFAVRDPRVPVTCAQRILLDRLHENDGRNEAVEAGLHVRWLATRSFGKQFNCNAFGVGAVTAPSWLLRKLDEAFWHHGYATGGVLVDQMCRWLAKAESQEFTRRLGAQIPRKKGRLRQVFETVLGYPSSAVITGPCTLYAMVEVPRFYVEASDGVPAAIDRFQADLYRRTGVLVAPTLYNRSKESPFVRVFLASHDEVLEEAYARFEAAGLRHDMAQPL